MRGTESPARRKGRLKQVGILVAAMAALDAGAQPEAIQALHFRGAIIGPESRTALISRNGTQKARSYRIGDGPLPGTRITAIHRDHAVIAYQGASHRLEFPHATPAIGGAKHAKAHGPSGTPAGAQATQATASISRLLGMSDMEANWAGRWRVTAARPRTFTWLAGLEPGDEITAFNGGRAEDLPPDLATYRSQLGDAPLKLTFERRGTRMSVLMDPTTCTPTGAAAERMMLWSRGISCDLLPTLSRCGP